MHDDRLGLDPNQLDNWITGHYGQDDPRLDEEPLEFLDYDDREIDEPVDELLLG